jgi:hypothetical protein
MTLDWVKKVAGNGVAKSPSFTNGFAITLDVVKRMIQVSIATLTRK